MKIMRVYSGKGFTIMNSNGETVAYCFVSSVLSGKSSF